MSRREISPAPQPAVFRPLAPLVPCLLAAATLLGCGEIRYGTGDSHDHILQTTRRVVPGQSVRAKAWQRGSELTVQVSRSCDLVEVHEIERTTVLEPDEDLTEEWVILGVAVLPLSSGIILLADSGAVSDNDRNAREYNALGPEGAIAGGVVLATIGALLATVPIVQMIRNSVPDEELQVVQERGQTLAEAVPCADEVDAGGAVVLGRFSGPTHTHGVHQLRLGTTDDSGRAVIDLAAMVPAQVLALQIEPATMQIWVDERHVAQVDLRAVRIAVEERQRRLDEDAWRQAGARRCRQLATEEACAGIRAYLQRFPEGRYTEDAEHLLGLLPEAPVVTSPEDLGRTKLSPGDSGDRGISAARRAAREACTRACATSCPRDPVCRARCTEEACPP